MNVQTNLNTQRNSLKKSLGPEMEQKTDNLKMRANCLNSGCPPRPALSPWSRAWESCEHTWAPWRPGKVASGKGHILLWVMVDIDPWAGRSDGLSLVLLHCGSAQRDSAPFLHSRAERVHCLLSVNMWNTGRHWNTSSTYWITCWGKTDRARMVCHALCRCWGFRNERRITCLHGIHCLVGSQIATSKVKQSDKFCVTGNSRPLSGKKEEHLIISRNVGTDSCEFMMAVLS